MTFDEWEAKTDIFMGPMERQFAEMAFAAGAASQKPYIKQLEAEWDKLKLTIALYEQALKASWPSGANGEAFDHWNAARKIIAKGENNA